MIVFCLGLPGPFAEWCDNLIARLLDRSGAAAIASWPSYDEMLGFRPLLPVLDTVALQLIKDDAPHVVVAARHPDERLRAVLAETNSHFVLALDDPRAAVSHMLARTGAPADAALWVVANSCPLVMRFASLPGALTLNADRARADPTATARRIAEHLGIDMAGAQIDPAIGPNAAHKDPPAPVLSDDERRLIEGAVGGYGESFARGSAPGQIVWRRELFMLSDDRTRRATGLVNIAGTPRVLLFGPYIQLPAARWTARVVLGFSPEAAGCSFTVDAYADGSLGEASITPPRGGVYAVDIGFTVGETSLPNLEIRVIVTNHNPRGQLALGRVILQPLTITDPEVIVESDDFTTALQL